MCLHFDAKFPPDRGYGYVGASRCRSAAGLFYFKKLRRTDWLPIRTTADSDEESERGDFSEAESADPYDGWCGDGGDDESCNSDLRSDGYLSDPESDGEFDKDGDFREIEDDPSM